MILLEQCVKFGWDLNLCRSRRNIATSVNPTRTLSSCSARVTAVEGYVSAACCASAATRVASSRSPCHSRTATCSRARRVRLRLRADIATSRSTPRYTSDLTSSIRRRTTPKINSETGNWRRTRAEFLRPKRWRHRRPNKRPRLADLRQRRRRQQLQQRQLLQSQRLRNVRRHLQPFQLPQRQQQLHQQRQRRQLLQRHLYQRLVPPQRLHRLRLLRLLRRLHPDRQRLQE